MEKCLFDFPRECGALRVKHCEGCKFRKTATEYSTGVYEAEQSLKRRGLRAVKKFRYGEFIMTVEKVVDEW